MAGMNAQQIRALDQSLTDTILSVGADMMQSINSGQITPNGNNNTITTAMRPVGLTRGFLAHVQAPIINSSTSAAVTLTDWGAANLISNVTLTDLDNQQRINTTGAHLYALNTAKEGFPFGAAIEAASQDGPVKFGSNFGCISAPGTIAASGTGTVDMYLWVPAAYGKRDLRGAIYTGVVNATGFLSMTLNTSPGVASGDAVQGVYSGAACTYGSVTYNIYQNYIDQLPRYASGPNAGKPMLPPISMRTQYRLQNTALPGIAANQDFPIPFSNFQSFLSAFAIFDNAGTLNAGTDINYWKLTAANTLQFFNVDPITQALRQRVRIRTDFPKGSYFFDFREQPVNTNQAGNMQLVLNASTAAAGALALVGWESFADVDAVLGAQSLPA